MGSSHLYRFVCPIERCRWSRDWQPVINVPMVAWPWDLKKQMDRRADEALHKVSSAFREHAKEQHPEVRNWDDQKAHDWWLRNNA